MDSPTSEFFAMKVFLTGVSCVGKTAIGAKLATLLGYPFFDLDHEIETFFGKPLERLQAECLSKHAFRKKACQALRHLLAQDQTENCVVALPPSGLMGEYPRLIKKAGGIAVVLEDTPENILARITFYDADSRPIIKKLTEQEQRYYLRDIRLDITYFNRTYRKADVTVDISGLGLMASVRKVGDVLVARYGLRS
jgi:shikimate kinase